MNNILLFVSIVINTLCFAQSKIYKPCELAQELVTRHGFPPSTIANWICIAKYESNFDTSAKGGPDKDESYDHGLFQINDRYWCATPGPGNECGVSCDALRTDDITATVKCVKKIYKARGLEAWVAWKNHCKNVNVIQYIKGCNLETPMFGIYGWMFKLPSDFAIDEKQY